jgi:hypothetical protein
MDRMESAPAPLVILGSPRSGTTFLARMVNRFFDINVATDNGTLLRLHAKLPHYEPLSDDQNMRRLLKHVFADHFVQERLVGRGLKATEEEIFARLGSNRTYSAVIEEILGSIAAERGKRGWGYKRASFARMVGSHVNDLFPTARFVHIMRDAREVALSMRVSPGAHERNWHFGAVDWVSHVEAGRQIGRQIGPERYREITYERLMAAPGTVLSEILDFSGAGPDREARVARIHSDIHELVKPSNTEKWKTKAPPDAVRQIERVAGPLLRDLGYPLRNPEIAGTPVGRLELVWLWVDRVFRNLFQSKLSIGGRYRVEVLKERWRARFGA